MFLLHKVLRVTSRSPACCDPRPWTWCAATFDKKYWSQPWMDIQILKESNKSHSSLSFEVIPPSPLSMNMEKVSANCVSRPGHPGLPGLSPRLTICRDIYSKLDTTMITRVGDCGWWQVATGDWMAMRYSISNIINNRNDFPDHELRQFAWSGAHTAVRGSQLITSLGGKWSHVEYFQLIS